MKGPHRCISQASAKPPTMPPIVNDLFDVQPPADFLDKSVHYGQKYLPRQ